MLDDGGMHDSGGMVMNEVTVEGGAQCAAHAVTVTVEVAVTVVVTTLGKP